MELNREQIIKALECCKVGDDCWACPYDNVGVYSQCAPKLLEDTLSLIKELTERNERLKSVEFTCGFIKPHKVLECPIFDEIVRTRADTVRKMQELIKERCIKGGIYPTFVASTIDQIAKEMLEGDNESLTETVI